MAMDAAAKVDVNVDEELAIANKKDVQKEGKQNKLPKELTWTKIILCFLGTLASLYVFLCARSLMGSAFKVLGGLGASILFTAVDNPIIGLMTGIFLVGIFIWYPAPVMRTLPLEAAKRLGLYASYFRFIPHLYILVAFVVIPVIFLAISATFAASVGGGLVLLLFVWLGLGSWDVYRVGWPVGSSLWVVRCGPWVLSIEQRVPGTKALEETDKEMRGLSGNPPDSSHESSPESRLTTEAKNDVGAPVRSSQLLQPEERVVHV